MNHGVFRWFRKRAEIALEVLFIVSPTGLSAQIRINSFVLFQIPFETLDDTNSRLSINVATISMSCWLFVVRLIQRLACPDDESMLVLPSSGFPPVSIIHRRSAFLSAAEKQDNWTGRWSEHREVWLVWSLWSGRVGNIAFLCFHARLVPIEALFTSSRNLANEASELSETDNPSFTRRIVTESIKRPGTDDLSGIADTLRITVASQSLRAGGPRLIAGKREAVHSRTDTSRLPITRIRSRSTDYDARLQLRVLEVGIPFCREQAAKVTLFSRHDDAYSVAIFCVYAALVPPEANSGAWTAPPIRLGQIWRKRRSFLVYTIRIPIPAEAKLGISVSVLRLGFEGRLYWEETCCICSDYSIRIHPKLRLKHLLRLAPTAFLERCSAEAAFSRKWSRDDWMQLKYVGQCEEPGFIEMLPIPPWLQSEWRIGDFRKL
ncbi:hypothetical protein C8J56DRAFT_880789 [Mycena floridula]|nr:hypothetical protein C8J56DRAFT_880789 [Mycena floridula]